MSLQDDFELIKEFLIESNENLSKIDQQMVEIERNPEDAELLASIFRTIHTIKGTCGFLGFGLLEGITHTAESILSQCRNGERPLSPGVVSVVLETVDATRTILRSIEKTGKEGEDIWEDLRQRLVSEEHSGAGEAPAPRRAVPDRLPAGAIEALVAKVKPEPPPPVIVPDIQPPSPPVLPESASKPSASVSDSTIRVDVTLLDKLMNLVGELVLARNQILQHVASQEDADFVSTSQRLNLITSELQESVMKTRMQPIGVVWNKLPRVIRDLAAICGKEVRLEMDGAETELDKTIIEAIKDPLTHIVRNCCDHGIEDVATRLSRGKPAYGMLSLRAYHEGGHVNIEIADDGSGIDQARVKAKAVERGLLKPEQAERLSEREAIHLVFAPGFSTAVKVSNISGRGVGMDVVKTNIEKIGGVVDLASRAGLGTTVRIKIPLTLAIIPGLVVASGSERFVIPQVSLVELVRLEGEEAGRLIETIHGTPVYRRRGSLLPIAYLNEILQLPGKGDAESVSIVVLQAEDRHFGLVVDGISDTQEIVVKPLAKQLKGLNVYAGSTIMGDGKVALILDVMGLSQRAGLQTRDTGAAAPQNADCANALERQTLLLFRAGRHDRLAVPLSLVARLEEFSKDRMEQAAGKPVVQYRGQILPLITLSDHLGGPGSSPPPDGDRVQVVVFSEGERSVGLVVDQIVDIVEDEVAVRRPSNHHGLVGSAVVGDKVTDFLDLGAVLDWGGERGAGGSAGGRNIRPLLILAGECALERGLLRSYAEMLDCRVVEARSVAEVAEAAALQKADAIVARSGLADEIRARLPHAVVYDVDSRDSMLRSIQALHLATAGKAEHPVVEVAA
ncbi:MAG: chemotaxis protein CheW [Acidobacteria bacterium]|nr:chemotaxis protein CheW [Acidobacteriota bacterium]